MRFSPAGARKMTHWSTKFYNTGEKLAWVLNGDVINVSPLATGARITDAAEISGQFDPEYVREFESAVNAGRWPQSLIKVSQEVVKPKTG
jgi:preprotein translocase subunit SecD